ncbi:MAG TPA: nitrilase-related carbon-nitrogen hydrolase [Thermoanaerobaculia bacterium]|nr:nitrilase-related carbon-nitrogen hydrolase [Thermoanaerobaculia bacterium]
MALWLLLLGGASLVAVSLFQTIVPAAAWLAPVLLLRAARDAKSGLRAWASVALAIAAGNVVALRGGIIPLPWFGMVAIALLAGALHAVPYLLDRAFAGRLGGVRGALVFPLAMTAVEYAAFRPSPFGSWGATAYSQTGNLPLLQLVALTGVWGICFVVHALAPALNAAWEARRRLSIRALRPLLAFAAMLAMVLVAGGVRLAAGGPSARVPVATVASADGEYDAAFAVPKARVLATASPAQRQAVAAKLESLWPAQLARTVAAARAGARLVAWPETTPVLTENLVHWLAETTKVAREHGVVIVATPWVVRDADAFPWVDNLVVLEDGGATVWSYAKAHPVLGIEDAYLRPGDGTQPVADVSVGRVTGAICHDLDFPWTARQAGRSGAGIFVAPSDDWPAIAEAHLQMAVVRAVENGVTILRPTHNGTSAVIDPLGRVQARGTSGRDAAVTLLAPVSSTPLRTLYPWVGDWFPVAALAGLLALVMAARRRDAAGPALAAAA